MDQMDSEGITKVGQNLFALYSSLNCADLLQLSDVVLTNFYCADSFPNNVKMTKLHISDESLSRNVFSLHLHYYLLFTMSLFLIVLYF
ncbi:unnamed protein product [Brugia timori]|uniref:Uncharacterized protein n=1 Tax=Brugia timori TaxID=42155 RepID=A0A3P7W2H0_9BILA|nr:unnamed protein product [Brugia timori]